MIDTDPVYEQIKYAKAEPARPRLYRRAYAFLHLWRQSRHRRLCRAAVRRAVAPDAAAGRSRSVAVAADSAEGEPRCFTTIATWENKGKNIEFEGTELSLVEARQFSPVSRPAAAPAAKLLRDGDAAAGRRRCAARSRATAGGSSIRARSRPTWRPIGDFIAGSRGEFTVAKDIYVRPNSGWFSDRAVCYLASGRPVVTMRTGFTTYCPAGDGLFDYATHDEALAAIDAIAADYGGTAAPPARSPATISPPTRVLADLTAAIGL